MVKRDSDQLKRMRTDFDVKSKLSLSMRRIKVLEILELFTAAVRLAFKHFGLKAFKYMFSTLHTSAYYCNVFGLALLKIIEQIKILNVLFEIFSNHFNCKQNIL